MGMTMTEFDALLDTRDAADFLTQHGYVTAPATLAKLRCVGGGPEFRRFGRRPLYKPEALLQWAQLRTSEAMHSTKEVA